MALSAGWCRFRWWQRRQHQGEPGTGNRLASEVAHVGVQRLGAGQCQYHRTENRHAHARVNDEEAHAPLMVGVILLVLGFESSNALASAYGVAVTGTMLITSI